MSEDTIADDNGSVFETTLVTTGLEVSQITEDMATESSGEPSFAEMSKLDTSVYAANPQIGVSLEVVSNVFF